MTYRDQVILVAVGLSDRGVILGYRGEGVFVACSPLDSVRVDYAEEVFPAKGYPGDPGLYVWRGTIDIDGEPIDGPYVDMRGKFDRAAHEDVLHLMGVTDPPMPAPAEEYE